MDADTVSPADQSVRDAIERMVESATAIKYAILKNNLEDFRRHRNLYLLSGRNLTTESIGRELTRYGHSISCEQQIIEAALANLYRPSISEKEFFQIREAFLGRAAVFGVKPPHLGPIKIVVTR